MTTRLTDDELRTTLERCDHNDRETYMESCHDLTGECRALVAEVRALRATLDGLRFDCTRPTESASACYCCQRRFARVLRDIPPPPDAKPTKPGRTGPTREPKAKASALAEDDGSTPSPAPCSSCGRPGPAFDLYYCPACGRSGPVTAKAGGDDGLDGVPADPKTNPWALCFHDILRRNCPTCATAKPACAMCGDTGLRAEDWLCPVCGGRAAR